MTGLSTFLTSGALALGDTVNTAGLFSFVGRMAISADGSLLAVITDHGFSIVRTGFTLSIAKTGTGSGTATSSPAGIDCGETCAASFPDNTVVTVTATPARNSTFSGFRGDCVAGTVTITADMSCSAAFDLK